MLGSATGHEPGAFSRGHRGEREIDVVLRRACAEACPHDLCGDGSCDVRERQPRGEDRDGPEADPMPRRPRFLFRFFGGLALEDGKVTSCHGSSVARGRRPVAEWSKSFRVTSSPSGSTAPLDKAKSTSAIDLRVRFCETDLMGIVHHASYLVYFEAGRVEWLRRRGVTYADWAARGVHLPVVEAQVSYKTPSRFDDLLIVETTLTALRSVSMKFSYAIRRDTTLIAEGFTRLGCVDEKHKLMKIPDHMRDVLLARETSRG
jgi:acyl-CoA thioester hydrolase